MRNRRLHAGDVVRHFKRETVTEDEAKANKYLYKIVAIAEHTETKEMMVVYQALYGDFRMYVRPYEMFMDKVDHDKYPNIRQKYRFEKISNDEDPIGQGFC
jgi:hypothetical protein